MKKKLTLIPLLFILCLLHSTTALANPGDIDLSFGGGDGIVYDDIRARLFNTSTSRTQITGQDGVSSLLMQENEKILALGYTAGFSEQGDKPHHLTISRYLSDGRLDESFGSNGRFILREQTLYGDFDITTSDLANGMYQTDMLIQPDGKILLFGASNESGSNTSTPQTIIRSFLLVRLTSEGQRDMTFGSNGVVRTTFDVGATHISKVFMQSDEKIVAIGVGNYRQTLIARYLPNGDLDTSYGSGGKKSFLQGNYRDEQSPYHLERVFPVMLSDNTLMFCGYYSENDDTDPNNIQRHAHYISTYISSRDGSFDTRFNGSGKVIQDFPNYQNNDLYHPFYYAAALQSDGKVIVAGTLQAIGGFPHLVLSPFLHRFNADGTVDRSFGVNGWLSIHLGSYWRNVFTGAGGTNYELRLRDYTGEIRAIQIQSNGRILIGGTIMGGRAAPGGLYAGVSTVPGERREEPNYRFFIMRLESSGVLDSSFGDGGKVFVFGEGPFAAMGDMIIKSNCSLVSGGMFAPTFDSYHYLSTDSSFVLTQHDLDACYVPAFPKIIRRPPPIIDYFEPTPIQPILPWLKPKSLQGLEKNSN